MMSTRYSQVFFVSFWEPHRSSVYIGKRRELQNTMLVSCHCEMRQPIYENERFKYS